MIPGRRGNWGSKCTDYSAVRAEFSCDKHSSPALHYIHQSCINHQHTQAAAEYSEAIQKEQRIHETEIRKVLLVRQETNVTKNTRHLIVSHTETWRTSKFGNNDDIPDEHNNNYQSRICKYF